MDYRTTLTEDEIRARVNLMAKEGRKCIVVLALPGFLTGALDLGQQVGKAWVWIMDGDEQDGMGVVLAMQQPKEEKLEFKYGAGSVVQFRILIEGDAPYIVSFANRREE